MPAAPSAPCPRCSAGAAGCVSMRDHYPVSRHRCSRYAQRLRAARTVRFPNDVVFQDHIRQGDLEQVGRFIRARKVTLDTIYPSGECAGRRSRGCQGQRRAAGPMLGRGIRPFFSPVGCRCPQFSQWGPRAPSQRPNIPAHRPGQRALRERGGWSLGPFTASPRPAAQWDLNTGPRVRAGLWSPERRRAPAFHPRSAAPVALGVCGTDVCGRHWVVFAPNLTPTVCGMP